MRVFYDSEQPHRCLHCNLPIPLGEPSVVIGKRYEKRYPAPAQFILLYHVGCAPPPEEVKGALEPKGAR